ncbi:hypothetical protein BDP27DRAFT_1429296 [Rhodocollybia butyracea]|uniref:Uncharacterized protein n=1 Tax=Rhodocollybia butyracea TaxID=206335 RepID=A0A9P5PDE0_9AGAR|nr:hypothetical protein BDP27DRAFT_1429296 [Rhodocollybia butyracea]
MAISKMDQSQVEVFLSTLTKKRRNLDYNIKEDGTKKMIYECAISVGDFLTEPMQPKQVATNDTLFNAYGEAVVHLKSVQDMPEMAKINSFHKASDFYVHLGTLRAKYSAVKPVKAKKKESKSKEMVDSDESEVEEDVTPAIPKTSDTDTPMKDGTTKAAALGSLKFNKVSTKGAVVTDQTGRLTTVRIQYSDVPGMDVRSLVYHRANTYILKGATSNTECSVPYSSPFKRPCYTEDSRVLWRPETEDEAKDAKDDRLTTEISMIAGYPEPDYKELDSGVIRSLNNRHRLDWIHHRSMAYYDIQAAKTAWNLYTSTNAVMFDRGLKLNKDQSASIPVASSSTI